ncbi:MAG: exonuclease SbcCD subunit D [Actinomycetota bacterium]|nr:exonuclease SbcCD subunit D [Actinomycetota bacterium]
MRILHTSDWHLGRSFHREDLLSAQADFVDHLVATVRTERVDAVVVAGDVYDRALPPVDAVQLASEALRRLAAEDVRVVVTSGNHDSAHRLGFASDLIDAAGIHLRTTPAGVGRPVMLEDRHGPVAFYGLPYLEPDAVREPWQLTERSHAAALGEAMRRVRADLRDRPSGTRSVLLAHAFVTGGEASESERDISVGGVSQVSAGVFDGADYVALGHLHGRQTIREQVRYCGSPLAYSFSESGHRKGCWLVDLDDTGLHAAEFVEAPVPRRVATVRGRLDDLLAGSGHAALEGCWLKVTLTDPVRPAEAMVRLRARFPHALVLEFAPDPGGERDERTWTERVAGLDDTDVAAGFVADARGTPADTQETLLLQRAVECCRLDGDAA